LSRLEEAIQWVIDSSFTPLLLSIGCRILVGRRIITPTRMRIYRKSVFVN